MLYSQLQLGNFFSFLGWELYSFNPLSPASLSTNTLQTLPSQGTSKFVINTAQHLWAVLCYAALVQKIFHSHVKFIRYSLCKPKRCSLMFRQIIVLAANHKITT